MIKRVLWFWLAFAPLVTSAAVAGPRAVLVLRPGLTAESVLGHRSPFSGLLPRAAIGVLNVAVRGPRVPASAYLTLGAGDRLAAGPLAEPARFPSERVEGDPAAVVYERRIGPLPPGFGTRHPHRLLHLAWGAYLNSVPDDSAIVTLGEKLKPLGGIAWLGVGEASEARLGALVALESDGIVSWGERIPDKASHGIARSVGSLLHRTPLVVLDLPSSFTVTQLATLLGDLARDVDLDLLMVSPCPPPSRDGAWDRLPPILGLGPHFPPGRLTSSTTRTAGLVANIDVPPTLLSVLGLQVPVAMGGKTIHSEGTQDSTAVLRLAQEATLAQRAIVPIGIGVGASAVLALVLALISLSGKTPRVVPIASFVLLIVTASPLALFLAPLTRPATVAGTGIAVLLWAVAAAMLTTWMPANRRRPVPWLLALTMIGVSGDLLAGGTLIARSAVSGYRVAGIRFYGVGNEYMGVLVGCAILAPLLFEEQLDRFRWVQATLFLGILVLIGSPRTGANLGGALTAAAGFAATLMLAVWPRRPLRALAGAGAALVAVGAACLLWDAWQPAAMRSHIGDFAHAVQARGWATAAPVLARKAEMNLRLLTSGFALVPIAGVAPLLGLWYHGAGRRLSCQFASRPKLRAAVGGSIIGAWTALLFNDSGVSPWMFITVSMIALLLDEQLRSTR